MLIDSRTQIGPDQPRPGWGRLFVRLVPECLLLLFGARMRRDLNNKHRLTLFLTDANSGCSKMFGDRMGDDNRPLTRRLLFGPAKCSFCGNKPCIFHTTEENGSAFLSTEGDNYCLACWEKKLGEKFTRGMGHLSREQA